MTGDISTQFNPNYSYIDNCLQAFYSGRYRDGLTILREGLDEQARSATPIDVKELIKHISAALSYLECELEDILLDSQIISDGETERRCSFCAKKQNEVARLIAGPAVFICNSCIEACSDILKSTSA